MARRQPRFSQVASALELIALLWVAYAWITVWTDARPIVAALAQTGISMLWIGGAFLLRWYGQTRESEVERSWLDARAVVDDDLQTALKKAEFPVNVVRAVKQVGNCDSLINFRDLIKKECGPELTDDQLDTILRFSRAAKLPIGGEKSSSGARGGEGVARHVFVAAFRDDDVVLDPDAAEAAEGVDLFPAHVAGVVALAEVGEERLDEVEAGLDRE
jgi:hypothetical protein